MEGSGELWEGAAEGWRRSPSLRGLAGPGAGPSLLALPRQRYLDEAEREKQQYMKELRAYQQSEAYKMCTEKIQEKKIKKGGEGPAPRPASRPPLWLAQSSGDER